MKAFASSRYIGRPEPARIRVERAQGLHGHQPHCLIDGGAALECVGDECTGEAVAYSERLVVVVVSSATLAVSLQGSESRDLGVVDAGEVLEAADPGPVQGLQHH